MFKIASYNDQRCERVSSRLYSTFWPQDPIHQKIKKAQDQEVIFQVYQSKIAALKSYGIISRCFIYVGQCLIKNPKPIDRVSDSVRKDLSQWIKGVESKPQIDFGCMARDLQSLLIPTKDLPSQNPLPVSIIKHTTSSTEAEEKELFSSNGLTEPSIDRGEEEQKQSDTGETIFNPKLPLVENKRQSLKKRRSTLLVSQRNETPPRSNQQKIDKEISWDELIGRFASVLKVSQEESLEIKKTCEENGLMGKEEKRQRDLVKAEEKIRIEKEKSAIAAKHAQIIQEACNALNLAHEAERKKAVQLETLKNEAKRLIQPFQVTQHALHKEEAKRQLQTEQFVGGAILFSGLSAVALTTAVIARKNLK